VGKVVGAWSSPPTPFSAEAKERVQLYLYPTLGVRGLFDGELYFYLYVYLVQLLGNTTFKMPVIFLRFSRLTTALLSFTVNCT
jgi:hypothetical protein